MGYDAQMVDEIVKNLVPDPYNGLRKRINYICADLHEAQEVTEQKSHPHKLNMFTRYLKSCNNDGHKIKEYTQTQVFVGKEYVTHTVCVVDKNGRLDGPYLTYSDNGKTLIYGWKRKGRPFGKCFSRDEIFNLGDSVRIYDKQGRTILNNRQKDGKFSSTINQYMNGIYRDKSEMKVSAYRLSEGKASKEYKHYMSDYTNSNRFTEKSGITAIEQHIAAAKKKIADRNATQHSAPTHQKSDDNSSNKPFPLLHHLLRQKSEK